jgi:predicted DNA-binding transcriptional regulator YafY
VQSLPPPSRGRPQGKFTQVHRIDLLRNLLLQRARGMTLQEIAEALDVTTRSARRYLHQIHQHEFELEQVPSQTRAPLWRVKPVERPRKIGLRRAQSYALLATRRLFEPMRGSAVFDEIDLAVRNLLTLANRPGRGPNAGMVDTALEDRFVHLPAVPADYRNQAEEIDVFYHAVADLRPVTCRHRPPFGEESNKTLHPYAMVLYQDAIYVVAAEVESQATSADAERVAAQTYPLEELHDASLSAVDRFELPADFDLRGYYQGRFGLFPSSRKTRVVVDFDGTAASKLRHRQIHPTQRLSTLRGGGLRITFQVDDIDSVAEWVLGFGSRARVIEPEELRQYVIRELRGALSLYRDRLATDPQD